MEEEAIKGDVVVEVVDINMGSNMVEVVDSRMDNINKNTLHLPRHIWKQLQLPRLFKGRRTK
jgi:dTDP-4-dehydrorhamnose 3,5-epimerase-like enzyme